MSRDTMEKEKYIKFGNGYTSIKFPEFGKQDFPSISSADYALHRGKTDASKYSEDQLIMMIKSGDYEEVYIAMGAIGERKIQRGLPYLKQIALYDDDKGIQREAIRTIRKINGKKACDILRFLASTGHKNFISNILNESDPDDVW